MKKYRTWHKILFYFSVWMILGGGTALGAFLFWTVWCQKLPETFGPWVALGLGGMVFGIAGMCVWAIITDDGFLK